MNRNCPREKTNSQCLERGSLVWNRPFTTQWKASQKHSVGMVTPGCMAACPNSSHLLCLSYRKSILNHAYLDTDYGHKLWRTNSVSKYTVCQHIGYFVQKTALMTFCTSHLNFSTVILSLRVQFSPMTSIPLPQRRQIIFQNRTAFSFFTPPFTSPLPQHFSLVLLNHSLLICLFHRRALVF